MNNSPDKTPKPSLTIGEAKEIGLDESIKLLHSRRAEAFPGPFHVGNDLRAVIDARGYQMCTCYGRFAIEKAHTICAALNEYFKHDGTDRNKGPVVPQVKVRG